MGRRAPFFRVMLPAGHLASIAQSQHGGLRSLLPGIGRDRGCASILPTVSAPILRTRLQIARLFRWRAQWPAGFAWGIAYRRGQCSDGQNRQAEEIRLISAQISRGLIASKRSASSDRRAADPGTKLLRTISAFSAS